VCARIAARTSPVELASRDLLQLRREPLRRAAHGDRLEAEANLEEVAQVVGIEVEHLRALVGHVLREAERLELAHRLADRRDAHAEGPGQLVQAERGPGRELAEDDRLAQLLEGVLGHRPVAHPTFLDAA
jgi:hypothetical protein